MGTVKIVLGITRQDRGLTQEQLARLVGLHVKTIEKWEQQKVRRLDKKIIGDFCRVLECNIDGVVIYE
ncbi:MAG: helix-turn-helix transcriptional regulator [Cyanobacteria bacterium P01_E01_bin.42]